MPNVRKNSPEGIATWPNCARPALDAFIPNAKRTVRAPEIATKNVSKARKNATNVVINF